MLVRLARNDDADTITRRARRFHERHGHQLVEPTGGAGNEELEPDAPYERVP